MYEQMVEIWRKQGGGGYKLEDRVKGFMDLSLYLIIMLNDLISNLININKI